MALWDWSVNETDVKWSFVIDTEIFAGNFERELTAYVIGECDEYGLHLAQKYIDMHSETESFKDLSDLRVVDPGDDGIHRGPCDLAPTPGWGNDGKGDHCKITSPAKAKKYPYPAYLSVAIFLSRKPTNEELAILAKRAYEFSSLPRITKFDSRPEVTGCRLVSERVVVESFTVESPK
jgi:hypothetical protein